MWRIIPAKLRYKILSVREVPWASCQIRKIAGAHAPGMPGTFSPPPRVSDPDIHHGTCVTHVPWCMPGSLISGFLWSRRRGKRSWHSRHMRNLQFYVSGKRPVWPHGWWYCAPGAHHNVAYGSETLAVRPFVKLSKWMKIAFLNTQYLPWPLAISQTFTPETILLTTWCPKW